MTTDENEVNNVSPESSGDEPQSSGSGNRSLSTIVTFSWSNADNNLTSSMTSVSLGSAIQVGQIGAGTNVISSTGSAIEDDVETVVARCQTALGMITANKAYYNSSDDSYDFYFNLSDMSKVFWIRMDSNDIEYNLLERGVQPKNFEYIPIED